MALELVGGAVLGAAVAELWKAVIDAKASALQPALARLESTLKAMIPRLDQISRLNSQLNLQHPEMEELVSLIINGRALVVKCSKISTINLRKKGQYSKELLDLDNSLSRYFNTILSLDHFKNTKEILVAVKGLEKKLAANIDGGVCNQSESAGKPKEEDLESEVLEAMKLLQDSFKEAAVKLSQDSKKEEKPKEEDLESEVLEAMKLLQDSFKEAAVKLSQNSKKEEIVKSDPKIVEINKSGKEYKKSKSTDGPKESGENSGSGVNYEMPQVITVILKVHMHCEACVQDIKKSIMRTKGVESAEPDLKSSQVTVTGVFDPPKLIEYVYEKTGKHAAIVKQEPEKKEEGKGKDAKEEKKGEDGGDKEKKGGGGVGGEKEEKKDGGGEEAKALVAAEGEEETKVDVELKRNEYYYYPPKYAREYYAYPPQIFSDENPNACSVM